MKRTETSKKKFTTLIAGALFAAIIATTSAAPAEAAPFVDYDAKGSITVTCKDTTGAGVEGAELQLIKVGSAVDDGGNAVFAAEEAFSDYEKEINGVTEEGMGEASLAAKIADTAESKSVSGQTATSSSDGTVTWKDLDLGIYLVVNTSVPEHHLPIDPFLITVPRLIDGNYIYDVQAEPKPTNFETTTTTTTTTITTRRIPQTGQVWWPVPILLCVGLFLVGLGIVLRRNE